MKPPMNATTPIRFLQEHVTRVIRAWKDPDVQTVLEIARETVTTSRRAGRRLEL